MLKPYEEIVKLLKSHAIPFEEIDHEPVFTSEQAAGIRGMSLHAGAKSLLLKVDQEFILAILPGDIKLDSKKLKQYLKAKDLRFAKPEEVKEIMGCKIGACYPFGSIANLKMLVDPSLSDNEYIFFNPGLHNKSLKMSWTDYETATTPELADIS